MFENSAPPFPPIQRTRRAQGGIVHNCRGPANRSLAVQCAFGVYSWVCFCFAHCSARVEIIDDNYMNTPDQALLDRWLAHHDAEAFAELVSRHSAMVYSACLRVIGNPADAQELAQECFARLLEGVPNSQKLWPSLGGWLHTVATRRALDWRKGQARRHRRETEYAQAVETDRDARDWDDVQGLVDEAIASLPAVLREPVVLHFLEGQSHRVIAKNLGVPRRTITSRIASGVEEVRKHLKRRGVVVTSIALGVAINAEAVPAALTEGLGRIALAGGTSSKSAIAANAWGVATTLGVLFAMKKAIVAVLVIVLHAGGSLLWQRARAGRQRVENANQVRLQAAKNPESQGAGKAPGSDRTYVPEPVAPSLVERAGTLLSPAQQPADNKTASGTLEGLITLSGEPLFGQTVMILYEEGAQYTARTGTDGKFKLPLLPVGEIAVYAMFTDDTGGVHRINRQATIRDGATTRLDIDFAGACGIAGQITCDGVLPEDATVRVTTMAVDNKQEHHQADADSNGLYSVVGVPSGPAQLLVTATAASGAHRMRRVNITIEAGRIIRQDIDISGGSSVIGNVDGLVSGDRVQVVAVLDAPRLPAQFSIGWWFGMREQLVTRDQVTSDESSYRLEGLDAGTYTVLALGGSGAGARDMASWRMQSAVVRVDGSNTVELDFDLTAGAERPLSVAGTVQGLKTGEKAALIVVPGEIEVPSPLTDEFLNQTQRNAASAVQVEDDFTFQVRGLESGTYTVIALAGAHGVTNISELRAAAGVVTVHDNDTASLDIAFAADAETKEDRS